MARNADAVLKNKLADTGPAKSLAAIGLEKFQIETLHRSNLADAPYNPRVLSDAAKRKLRAGLKRHGMVTPITWNRRTGHIVGGHQRLHQLDTLAGTSNYELSVAVIDVDEPREKELNILMNNPTAQGDWDITKLGELMSDKGIDVTGTGFDEADIVRLFGTTVQREVDEQAITEMSQKLKALQDSFIQMRPKGSKEADDFYIVVVFRDWDQCTNFCEAAKLPQNRYQSGADLMRLCNLDDEALAKAAIQVDKSDAA
jgi:hypothetical protein